MRHQQTIRILPNAKTAVLMIHGIVGSPDHFRTVLPLEDLVPEEYSLCNILLCGHGGNVQDFSHSSMARWRKQTMDLFITLANSHEQVILVGHSMGCLLAMEIALKTPEKVQVLFLLQAPLTVRLRGFAVINMLRYSFGCLDMQDPVQAYTFWAGSVAPTKQVWKYLPWIPRVLELFAQMGRISRQTHQIRVPLIAWQSRKDGLVGNRSAHVLQRAEKAEVHVLAGSSHFYYTPEETEQIRSRFREVLS